MDRLLRFLRSSRQQDYLHRFNYIRIHRTLGCMSPVNHKFEHAKKVVSLSVDIP
ncbi:IS3 family transposase [Priestia megaterium]|uniref:IS3 family transposase n=1 Tax=Priestia TaxID=2800373 RepID=UPI00386AD037